VVRSLVPARLNRRRYSDHCESVASAIDRRDTDGDDGVDIAVLDRHGPVVRARCAPSHPHRIAITRSGTHRCALATGTSGRTEIARTTTRRCIGWPPFCYRPRGSLTVVTEQEGYVTQWPPKVQTIDSSTAFHSAALTQTFDHNTGTLYTLTKLA
jgi:hypothetical protein